MASMATSPQRSIRSRHFRSPAYDLGGGDAPADFFFLPHISALRFSGSWTLWPNRVPKDREGTDFPSTIVSSHVKRTDLKR